MTIHSRRVILAALAGAIASLIAALGAARAAADTVIATESRMTPVNAFRDRVVWLHFDPAAGRFQLMTRAAGTTTPVPVAPAPLVQGGRAPFQADLGAGPEGQDVLAYTRCRPADSNPYWPGTCDIHMYDFASGRSRRLRASTAAGSEFLPTVSGKRVAYARYVPGQQRPRLYWSWLRGRKRHRLPGGPRGDAGPGAAPHALDLSGRRLAFWWLFYEGSFGWTEIRLDRIGRRGGKRIARALSYAQGGDVVVTPTFAGRGLYYGRLNTFDTTIRVERYDLRSGRRSGVMLAPFPPPVDVGFSTVSQGGPRTFYTATFSLSPVTVRVIDAGRLPFG